MRGIANAILQFYNDNDETRNSHQTTGMYCHVAVTSCQKFSIYQGVKHMKLERSNNRILLQLNLYSSTEFSLRSLRQNLKKG